MTLGALAALAARGVRVPGDMAVVGFDDFEWTDVLRPHLTTVAQPTYEIGTTAARLLLARIEHRAEGMPRQVVLSPRLIARESCGSGYRPGPAALEATFGRVGTR